MSFGKNGVVKSDYENISNLYTGKQVNYHNCTLTYNYQTDIFKDYGFNTCTKFEPVASPSYLSDGKRFIAYSYFIGTGQTDISAEYVISLYAYVSEDCNADFAILLEHSNTWVQTSSMKSTTLFEDSTKGKVIWAWGKFKPSPNDGKVYVMLYPNRGYANIFTKGYQLFTGVTIYKGTDIIKPINNNISGTGIIQSENISINPKFITAINYIET